MAFDFAHISVPFRMQPGLQRITAAQAQLTPLRSGSALHAEKLQVCQAGQAIFSVPGFDASAALQTATRSLPLQVRAFLPDVPSALDLALAAEEDLCVIDGPSGHLVWLCVCTPSHWNPATKIGHDFAAIHAPVADSAALLAAAPPLLARITQGPAAQRYWRRQAWTISPSPRYDQHPLRQPRAPWPTQTTRPASPAATSNSAHHFASQCWLRWECQTLQPVLHPDCSTSTQTLFSIRVGLLPLTQAVQQPWQAKRLADSLASMSDAVLTYKNLLPARAALLAWCATLARLNNPENTVKHYKIDSKKP
ncbi:MAG: heme-dependent oxidative N-demethylase subunit alpha family protein [Burkholderiales bacterium]